MSVIRAKDTTMTISTVAALDPVHTKQKLEASIAVYEKKLSVVKTVLDAIKAQDGKTFSKRVETAARTALPDHTVYYQDSGMIYLDVWGPGIEYNSRVHLFLGDKSNGRYSDKAAREKHAVGYLKLESRIAELKATLPELDAMVAEYNKAADALNLQVRKLAPIQYII